MNKIVNLGEYKDEKEAAEKAWQSIEKACWQSDELMCLCGYRYIAIYEWGILLKDLECKACGKIGQIFKTGQD